MSPRTILSRSLTNADGVVRPVRTAILGRRRASPDEEERIRVGAEFVRAYRQAHPTASDQTALFVLVEARHTAELYAEADGHPASHMPLPLGPVASDIGFGAGVGALTWLALFDDLGRELREPDYARPCIKPHPGTLKAWDHWPLQKEGMFTNSARLSLPTCSVARTIWPPVTSIAFVDRRWGGVPSGFRRLEIPALVRPGDALTVHRGALSIRGPLLTASLAIGNPVP